jgi:hypothetical protein
MRGRQLKRQRQAVEQGTEFGDGRCVRRRQAKVGLDGLRPLHEERHGGRLGYAVHRWQLLEVGEGKRRHDRFMLSGEIQDGAAFHQHLQVGRRGQQLGHERGRGRDLLEVIEQQQPPLVAQKVLKRLRQRLTGLFLDAKHLGDRRRHQGRIADGRQRHKEDALFELIRHAGGDA